MLPTTKKQMKSSYFVLIAMLILLTLLLLNWPGTQTLINLSQKLINKSSNTTLTYILARTNPPKGNFFSLDPKQSDSFDNITLMGSVIGTLLRYGDHGLIEPYLAEKWTVSDDQLKWEFDIRPNLKCSDGELITAQSFEKTFKKILHRLAKKSSLMTFNHLKGWDKFISFNNEKDFGLKSSGNKLIFELDTKVDDILDSFTTLYFGYWCSGNFKNEEFDPSAKFISSGAYEIIENPTGNAAKVKKRKDFFDNTNSDFDKIEFRSENITDNINSYSKTIVRFGMLLPKVNDINKFVMTQAPPLFLSAFILSPFIKNGLFATLDNRKVFQQRLRKFEYPHFFKENSLLQANYFYENAPSKFKEGILNADKINYSGQDIYISTPLRMGNEINKVFEDIIFKLLPEVPKNKIHFNEYKFDMSLLWEKRVNNTYFDIRITSVDIGGSITNSGTSGVEMMFCTKMGVGFPDVNGNICKLSREYINQKKDIDQNFINRFNQILYKDAAVIPYFHSGITWLYSNDVDTKTIPVGIGSAAPIYQRIRFNRN